MQIEDKHHLDGILLKSLLFYEHQLFLILFPKMIK